MSGISPFFQCVSVGPSVLSVVRSDLVWYVLAGSAEKENLPKDKFSAGA